MGTQLASNIISAGAALITLAAVIVAIVAVFQNRNQARDNWDHTQQLAREERQHQSRPVLVPVGQIAPTEIGRDIHIAGGVLNWNYQGTISLKLHNMGGGAALNVH